MISSVKIMFLPKSDQVVDGIKNLGFKIEIVVFNFSVVNG